MTVSCTRTTNNTMNNTMNNANEAVFGNEVKRRRINDAGDHLKVWKVQEPVQEVHQEPVQEVHQEPPVQEPLQEPPVQLIGRTVVLETTDQRICRGTIQELFVLNGERAIHILTDDGQNRIYTTSQLCAACVLHNAEEEVMSPIPRRESEDEVVQIDSDGVHIDSDVVHIDSDDDQEVQELTRRMEVVEIDSDSDSDATTQQLEDEDDEDDEDDFQDDFPDVEFQPQQDQQDQQQDQQEEDNCCCAICLDATDPARNFVSLNCGHQFHFACIVGNMANGGHNRNQCPMCRDRVIHADDDVHSMDVLRQELSFVQQHREELSVEYARVMGMQLQINIRYHEEREARDVLERRAYICGLNERIAAVVVNAANNDIRRQNGAAAHAERQIRDLCMSFGMMAYDAQYDYHPEYPEYPADPEDPEDRMD